MKKHKKTKPDSITRDEWAEVILLEISKFRVKQSSYTFPEGVEAARRMLEEVERYGPYVSEYRAWADSEGNLIVDQWLYAYIGLSSRDIDEHDGLRKLAAEAHDGLRKLAGYVLSINKPLPEPLWAWTEEFLLGERPRPKLKPGNPGNEKRDRGIRCAVQHLVFNGMDSVRNDERKNPAHDSACDAVAEVVGLKYHRVRVIWNERCKLEF